jgi:Transposase DDE domain group 1
VGFIVTTLAGTNRAVAHFYNQRGTAEQWIKEGKEAAHWTRLSCHRFRANEVRLLLGVIAYNLGNLLRRLALPRAIQSWSLTSLQQRLFKTGGRLIRHARYFILQLAESYLTPRLFGQILGRIERLAWHPT